MWTSGEARLGLNRHDGGEGGQREIFNNLDLDHLSKSGDGDGDRSITRWYLAARKFLHRLRTKYMYSCAECEWCEHVLRTIRQTKE